MEKKKDITVADLNKSLKKIGRDAQRINRALGRDTMYEEDGYLVKLKPTGRKHRIKKIKQEFREVVHQKESSYRLLS